MPLEPITYHIIQLQRQHTFLVAAQDKLQCQIDEIDESIHIITELSNVQPTTPTPQPPDIIAESLRVFISSSDEI